MSEPRRDSKWWGWGDPAIEPELDAEAVAVLSERIGELTPSPRAEELEAFEGDGRVKAVLTKSGRAIECDTVVVGAGVRPDAMLAQRAGLEVDDGIVCDSKLQTSAAGIYAAGDCCSYDSVVHGRRLV